jgi:hypothetical protein
VDGDLGRGAVEVILEIQPTAEDRAPAFDLDVPGRDEELLDDVHGAEPPVPVDELGRVRWSGPKGTSYATDSTVTACNNLSRARQSLLSARLRDQSTRKHWRSHQGRSVVLSSTTFHSSPAVTLVWRWTSKCERMRKMTIGAVRSLALPVMAPPSEPAFHFVAAPRDEEVLRDIPADLLELALLAHEGEADAVRRVGHGLRCRRGSRTCAARLAARE